MDCRLITFIHDFVALIEISNNLYYLPGKYDDSFNPIIHSIQNVIPIFFAFGSDLKDDGKSEINRYKENDPEFCENPYLRAICVVGKGYWYHNFLKKKWVFHPPTEFYDEVIDFLSGIINSIADILVSRRYPRLGTYLMLIRNSTMIQ